MRKIFLEILSRKFAEQEIRVFFLLDTVHIGTFPSILFPKSSHVCPFREFPLSWMKRHIESSGLVIVNTRNFAILHSEDSANRQIKVARTKLEYIANSPLQEGMKEYLNDLE
jgi:hypothetical protein